MSERSPKEVADSAVSEIRILERMATAEQKPPVPEKPKPPVPPRPPGNMPGIPSLSLTLDRYRTEARFVPASLQERGSWRFLVHRSRVADCLVIFFVEQFAGFDASRVSFALINGFKGTGAQLFKRLTFNVSTGGEDYEFHVGDRHMTHAVQVRGTLFQRYFVGPDAEALRNYEHITPVPGYPDWVHDVCHEGLAAEVLGSTSKPAVTLGGIYRIGDPQVKGESSLNGSHGGWKIAPYHMGPEGWQRGARMGHRWAAYSFEGILARTPLAAYSETSLSPHNSHEYYWCGRANVELDGYAPDVNPECTYLAELEKYEAHDFTHEHRQNADAAMLAPKDAVAQWFLAEISWHDTTLWLDGKAGSKNQSFWTANEIIARVPAHKGWSGGGRGLAHAIRSFLYAEPYMSFWGGTLMDSTGEPWRDKLVQLMEHLVRPNGLMHSKLHDNKFPLIEPACKAREIDLMYPNYLKMGMITSAKRCRETMHPMGGSSVAEAFDPMYDRWFKGAIGEPNYYPDYDLIRGIMDTLDMSEPWSHPFEQQISMVHPVHLGVAR